VPQHSPGYWRTPYETAEHFDEEVLLFGCAVKWIDETDVHQGLKFDGRICRRLQTGHPATLWMSGHCAPRSLPPVPVYPGRGAYRHQLKEVGAMVFRPGRACLERPACSQADARMCCQAPVIGAIPEGARRVGQDRHRQRQPIAPCACWRAAHTGSWGSHGQGLDQPSVRC